MFSVFVHCEVKLGKSGRSNKVYLTIRYQGLTIVSCVHDAMFYYGQINCENLDYFINIAVIEHKQLLVTMHAFHQKVLNSVVSFCLLNLDINIWHASH